MTSTLGDPSHPGKGIPEGPGPHPTCPEEEHAGSPASGAAATPRREAGRSPAGLGLTPGYFADLLKKGTIVSAVVLSLDGADVATLLKSAEAARAQAGSSVLKVNRGLAP